MRLLQLLHAPPVLRQSPRVLGVDEFAFRQGCTYGTILVDVEKRRPIDVLPDRTSETLASWLVAHPGVQIVCRDRASAYTRAIKEAAPHALEVADRWHLLRNLSQAVEKICQQHRACLRKYGEQVPSPTPRMPLLEALPPTLIVQRVHQPPLIQPLTLADLVCRGAALSTCPAHLGQTAHPKGSEDVVWDDLPQAAGEAVVTA